MIEKILLVSDREIVLYYSNRPPFKLYSAEGEVLALLEYFLRPSVLSFSDFKRALATEGEETCLNITSEAA